MTLPQVLSITQFLLTQFCILMHICDKIKGNESDVRNIDFELQA